MFYRKTILNKVESRNLSFISLIIFMVFASNSAVSGWFGYDTREECSAEKQGELMSRWINPLSNRDARIAAKQLCRKYPSSSEIYLKEKLEKLRSMSISELRAERNKALKEKRKAALEWGTSSFIYKGYETDIIRIDGELNRRRK